MSGIGKLSHAWHDMRQRCYNPNNCRYHRYGARGISVCSEWLESFEAFRLWSERNGFGPNLTIDRIDNDKNYEPGNCRWTTQIEQAANRSTTNLLTFEGQTLPLPEWARRYGLTVDTLWRRVFVEEWSIDRALTAPIQLKQKIAHLQPGSLPELTAAIGEDLMREGYGYGAIAKMCDRSVDYVRRLLDPQYRAQANERSANYMRSKYKRRVA